MSMTLNVMMKSFRLKIFPFAVFFIACTVLCPISRAENVDTPLSNRLAKYPEVLVKYGQKKITRQEAMELLQDRDLSQVDDVEFEEILKRILEEKIYLDIISFFLEKYDFKPSYQMAYDYLQSSQGKLPSELVKSYNRNQNIQQLASDKNYQLTVATLLYLKKHNPETTYVSPDEIEFFYRVNQNIFLHDVKVSVAFLAVEKTQVDSRKIINQTYSKLLQGVSFEKLAEQLNANLPKKFYEPAYQARLLEKAAELESGEYSSIMEFDDSFAIVMVKNREQPKYISLQDASFFIQSIIESRKCAAELEKILEKSLQLIDVEYFF